MTSLDRRNVCAALAAFSAFGLSKAASAAGPVSEASSTLSRSAGVTLEHQPVTHQEGGGSMWPLIKGTLPTGETVDIHETILAAGQMPHPPHRHRHSEFTLICEGTLEFYNDGKPEIVNAGGLIFAASNVLHGWKNVGALPARYFVVGIGTDEKQA
jgi:quercetin dioxygenase-like cupin family protein